MQTFNQLRTAFRRFCRRLEVERALHTRPQHDGSAHVEISEDQYHYVVTERGTELDRRSTPEVDELLYWLTCDVVFELASAYELQHRVKGQSFRRLLFQKELELLARIKPEWAARRQAEIDVIVRSHPYDDEVEG